MVMPRIVRQNQPTWGHHALNGSNRSTAYAQKNLFRCTLLIHPCGQKVLFTHIYEYVGAHDII